MLPSAGRQDAESFLLSTRAPTSTARNSEVGVLGTKDVHGVPFGQAGDAPKHPQMKYVCNLSIHDNASAKDDILVDMGLFAPASVAPGDLVHVRGIKGSWHNQYPPGGMYKAADTVSNAGLYLDEHNVDLSNPYLFRVRPMPSEMAWKHPDLQFSISSQIASAFHLVKGSQVILTPAKEADCSASHLELVFRDQYLARADMWRLVNSELANKCIHKGQRIAFLGNIKATIKSIFIDGKRVHSACFTPSTKPIFRSESARYVVFIQMSKEMWDFDAEGTGEIMFDKVINGFLPELFKRWQSMETKHLLSIILFSRMVYNDKPAVVGERSATALPETPPREAALPTCTKDFYRVVVSDVSGCESASILIQLKKEFKVFLRNISTRKPESGDFTPMGTDLSVASLGLPMEVVAGRPSTAAHGNILEAINLASSQFSSDYIDRDLVRTGVSIILISPGTGLFEVDYDLLATTTDNLIDNGVGIDLVCLSRMPLHSVPLFQYKQPHQEVKVRQKLKDPHSLSIIQSFQTPSPSSFSPGSYQLPSSLFHSWSFGIPHWIDVSFWTSLEEDARQIQRKSLKSVSKTKEPNGPNYKPFLPRVKMYELQMMGVMENSERDISIPRLVLGESFAASRPRQAAMSFDLGESKRLQGVSSGFSSNVGNSSAVTDAMLSSSPRSLNQNVLPGSSTLIQKMEDHDELLFRNPRASRRRKAQRRVKHRLQKDIQSAIRPASMVSRKSSLSIKQDASDSTHVRQSSTASIVSSSTESGVTPHKPNAMPRSISFGLRGLTPKAIATASAKVDITQSPAWSTKSANRASISQTEPTRNLSSLSGRQDTVASSAAGLRPFADHDPGQMLSSDSDRQDSRPIPIRGTSSRGLKESRIEQKSPRTDGRQPDVHDRVAALSDVREVEGPLNNIEYEETTQSLPPVLSPSTALAPWLTILNPCNPSKTRFAETTRLGRWQHIFPRAPKTSQMKWKSLCSPAAVPLTTEEFPSADELEEEYKRESYVVTLPEEMDLSERPRSLVNELLAFRLSRGFQIVVGDRLAEIEPSAAIHAGNVFCEKILGEVQSTIFLSRGSTIHRLTRSSLDRLEVEVLTRHGAVANDNKTEEKSMVYTPLICSMLAESFQPQAIPTAPRRGAFNWDMIDAFIAGHEQPEAAQYVEHLRPWRARFVLIPIDPPTSIRRVRSSEDTEEEIRLEGIRKLTQLWQRFRFIPQDKRGYQPPVRTSKDPNPLDISYQTKDPSAVIAAELESILEGDETGRPVQLLPEPDLYQRTNLDLKTLAETLQGEKGVRMLDRRWHLRLHYNCFIGSELTDWLLQNFRDVDTRVEAEELGKELMTGGLFKHVEQRHDFRDGNFFYQIEVEYRTPRPESKGWFGRGKSSVPSTPMTDQPASEPQRTNRSRASSNADTAPETEGSTYTEKRKQLSVALSKSLFYDVDHRRRSYRQELINLHYDRLHNPDNCYHIRVEWMNTTPRFIQEAVVSWATTVDRFGLRLVEVPIGEASSITGMHPFRAPYAIELARSPPSKQPRNYFDTTSLVSQPQPDSLFYQKALMKHFNFVLDFEAASSYPADVQVSYSWGKPDFCYPQYIHRSGVLIAQITNEGHFLLLANRLYNNRSAAAPPSHQEPPFTASSETHTGRHSNAHRPSPRGGTYRSSPLSSPYSSPAVRATKTNLDVPLPTTNPSGGPSPFTDSKTFARTASSRSSMAMATSTSAEQLTRDFQNFCSSPSLLDAFYVEVLSKAATPSSTPLVATTKYKTPLMTPSRKFTDTLGAEGEIPNLDLPGSVLGDGGMASPMRAKKMEERDEKEHLKAAMREVEMKRAVGEGSPAHRPARDDV